MSLEQFTTKLLNVKTEEIQSMCQHFLGRPLYEYVAA